MQATAKIRACIKHIGEEPPDSFRPPVDALDRRDRGLQLNVLCTAGEVAVDVAVIHCRNRALDNLHILLRHRPRSIRRPFPDVLPTLGGSAGQRRQSNIEPVTHATRTLIGSRSSVRHVELDQGLFLDQDG
jgi:hypothetical protein